MSGVGWEGSGEMAGRLEQKSVLLWGENAVGAESSQTWRRREGEEGGMGRWKQIARSLGY